MIKSIKKIIKDLFSKNKMRIGIFDPMRLVFGIMSVLMRKNIISYDEAVTIIRDSLPPEMPENEKVEIINSMVIRHE
jgi:hypothetical protein